MKIRKKRGAKIDPCGTTEKIFKKIKGCHILTLSLVMGEVIYRLGSKFSIIATYPFECNLLVIWYTGSLYINYEDSIGFLWSETEHYSSFVVKQH